MDDNFDHKVERWIKDAVSMTGTVSFTDSRDPKTVTLSEINAYHMGVRDILVRLLRECPEDLIQRTRDRLKEHKSLFVLLQ